MRSVHWLGCACLLALVLSAGNADAQFNYTGEGGCNKGLFWPFVREPGDCLTDTEIQSGMRGTYRGSEVAEEPAPVEAESQPAQVQRSAPVPAATAGQATSSAPAATPATPPTAPSAAPVAGGAAAATAETRIAPQQVGDSDDAEVVPADDDRAEYLGPGGCTKGLFWPFVRRPGDCLTDTEIQSGRTGTYQ